MSTDAGRIRWTPSICAVLGGILPPIVQAVLSYAAVADWLRAHGWDGVLAVLDFRLGFCQCVWMLLVGCGAGVGYWFGTRLERRKGTDGA